MLTEQETKTPLITIRNPLNGSWREREHGQPTREVRAAREWSLEDSSGVRLPIVDAEQACTGCTLQHEGMQAHAEESALAQNSESCCCDVMVRLQKGMKS